MEVKDRIIIGAVNLMNIGGVKNTTMDAVARSLGISKRTIYEHFVDKRELITACIIYLTSEQERIHNEIVEQSVDVIDEVATIISVLNNESQFRGRVASEVKRLYPDLHLQIYDKFYRRSFERILEQLQRGKKQGLIVETTNSNFAAYVMLDSIHSLMVNPEKLFMATSVSPIEAFRYVLICFFRGIATNEGIKKIDMLIKQQQV